MRDLFYESHFPGMTQSSDVEVAFLTCGEALMRWRTQRGATQQGLGEQIGVTGAYLAQVENGARIPSDNVCVLLREVLEPPSAEWAAFTRLVAQARARARDARRQRRNEVMKQAQTRELGRAPAAKPSTSTAREETTGDHALERTAIEQLRVVLRSPYRDAALAALDAWANRVRQEKGITDAESGGAAP